jgi:hypothetical protein
MISEGCVFECWQTSPIVARFLVQGDGFYSCPDLVNYNRHQPLESVCNLQYAWDQLLYSDGRVLEDVRTCDQLRLLHTDRRKRVSSDPIDYRDRVASCSGLAYRRSGSTHNTGTAICTTVKWLMVLGFVDNE